MGVGRSKNASKALGFVLISMTFLSLKLICTVFTNSSSSLRIVCMYSCKVCPLLLCISPKCRYQRRLQDLSFVVVVSDFDPFGPSSGEGLGVFGLGQ